MSNKLTYILLSLIVVLSIFLRFFRLDNIPTSLNWDEVAAGYNAYTIANWGADEYGNKFPIVFKSFADDKHPVHVYATAVIVKIFGLSDFNVRASSALVGVLSVIAIFVLARELLKNKLVALFSSLFLAISPYHIHFSRGLWENNFALFFLIAGLAGFYIGLRKKNYLLPLSFVFFGLSFFSYHSAKIVTPIVVLFVCLTNAKKLFENKRHFAWIIVITMIFVGLIIKEPKILGFARVNQTKFSEEMIAKSGGQINIIFNNYKKYFAYSYLFQNGDLGPRASVKVIGEFYKIDLILFFVGLIALFIKRKWYVITLILIWLLISPIPGAVSSVDPSAIRGIFMIGPVMLLSAVGAFSIVMLFKNKQSLAKYKFGKLLQTISLTLILILIGKETVNYLNYYSKVYPVKEAIEWQYGMKQIVEYSKENPDFYKMYVDKIRQQPYIFFLYYLQVPLPEFLSTVRYDETESKSFNTVLSFGKYQFGGWNIIGSYPNAQILYAITPSYYTGLRYIQQFDVAKLIKYPDRTDAFYIVEGHN
ncbi:MAG: glycosyltransferase family 39 protein [Candidatus Woesebacteria bacterium]|nr:glycosyltransferase family 39 protein [Candidatus Woesebacteria bacterium]